MQWIVVPMVCILAVVPEDPPPGMTVSGRVEYPNGRPAPEHKVIAECDRTLEPALGFEDFDITDIITSDPTGADGTFVVRGLPRGVCVLETVDPQGQIGGCGVDHEGATVPCLKEQAWLPIHEGVNVEGIVLAPPAHNPDFDLEETVIQGRVVDPQGLPAAGHHLGMRCERPYGGSVEVGCETSEDGGFEVRVRVPTGTACYLWPYRCPSPDEYCEPPLWRRDILPKLEITTRVELTEGEALSGVLVRAQGVGQR